jgi:hypothetical protein
VFSSGLLSGKIFGAIKLEVFSYFVVRRKAGVQQNWVFSPDLLSGEEW